MVWALATEVFRYDRPPSLILHPAPGLARPGEESSANDTSAVR